MLGLLSCIFCINWYRPSSCTPISGPSLCLY